MSDLIEEQKRYYQARAWEYDDWWYSRGRYDRGGYLNRQWELEGQTVRDALLTLPPQKHILEMASGTGIWTQELVRLGEKITCVDASSKMNTVNKAKVQSDTVEYIEADLFTWQPKQQFDMIFFGFWLSHVPEAAYHSFLKRVSAMLKPNGHVFMVDSLRNKMATAHNQNMLEASPIHKRVLNDGREFKIYKVFYEPDALQSDLADVNITADVRTTDQFFIYAHGTKDIS